MYEKIQFFQFPYMNGKILYEIDGNNNNHNDVNK